MASNYQNFNISCDLMLGAQSHIAFLQDVDERSEILYRSDVVKNAIRRYEKMWLPLLVKYSHDLAKYSGDTLLLDPPLDVHWIWHVHMLCPRKYIEDCMNIISQVPDHKFHIGKQAKKISRQLTLNTWKSLYPNEPFDIDPDNIDHEIFNYDSKLTYDIVAASERQKVFFYNVSLPHYGLYTFMGTAKERYQKFVNLKKLKPNAFIVPMYDVDLMWHTHQLHPKAYQVDTISFLGVVLNHDDTTTDRSEGSKLMSGDRQTRELWKETYGENFPIPGVMYRGAPPKGKLLDLSDEIDMHLEREGSLKVIRVHISGNVKEKFKPSGEVIYGGGGKNILLPQVKKLPFVWNPTGIEFFINTTSNHNLDFYFTRHDGIKGMVVGKRWISPRFNPQEFIRLAYKDSGGARNIEFHMTMETKEGIVITVTCLLHNTWPLSLCLEFVSHNFESTVMPETDEAAWGPIPLPKLLEGIPNACTHVTHT